MSQWISLLVATMLLVNSAPIDISQKWHTMTFQADAPGVDENPLRGFVPYSYRLVRQERRSRTRWNGSTCHWPLW